MSTATVYILAVFLLIACLTLPSHQARSRNPLSASKTCYRYTSSDSIASLSGTFYGSFVSPAPKVCPGPTGTCDLYINAMSCLGWAGPLGASG